MLWAVLVIVGSVAAGAALAFVPGKRDGWLGPARTFALAAALSVVLVHLMPEAFEGAGGWAVLALALGFYLPAWIGKLGALLWRARDPRAQQQNLALEASYFGLLLHHVGDGMGLGAYTGELSAGHGSGGVVTALAAHVVPVVAIVVLTFDAVRGRGHALGRAAGLAVASLLGVLAAHALPGGLFAEASPWVAALVGGTLLHVVSHDLESNPPRGTAGRNIELAAGALGLLVSLIGVDIHAEPGEFGISLQFRQRFWEFCVELSPLVLVLWLVGARWLAKRATSRAGVGGAAGVAGAEERSTRAGAGDEGDGLDTRRDAGAAEDVGEATFDPPPAFEFSVFAREFDHFIRASGPWLLLAIFTAAWIDVLVLGSSPLRPFAGPHRHDSWQLLLSALTGFALVRSIWLVGPRGWLLALGRALGPAHVHGPEEGHGHTHGEGHAHDDEGHGAGHAHAHGEGHAHAHGEGHERTEGSDRAAGHERAEGSDGPS